MNQDDTKLYDIYLRAFILTRSHIPIQEVRDLGTGTSNAAVLGTLEREQYSGKDLFAFALGVSDGSIQGRFPQTKALFVGQINH